MSAIEPDITRGSRFREAVADEFRPGSMVSSLVSGSLLFVLEISIIVSFAVLVFSNQTANLAPAAIGTVIIADAALILFLCLTSSYSGTIAIAQDAPAAILALASAQVLQTMSSTDPASQMATILMLLMVAGVLTGLFFLILGRFKLGGLARYLPYPVMGGFLAGTGWLLLTGGISTMTSATGLALLEPRELLHWLPGFLFGVLLLVISRNIRNALALPISILVAIGVFFLVMFLLGQTPNSLLVDGWLLGLPPSEVDWRLPLNATNLAAADWEAIISNVGHLIPVVFISAIALLLNANGIELVVGKDIDLSHELVASGLGNALTGILGGIVGYHAISLTTLNHTMSGGRRLPGIVMAALLVITIGVGTTLLGYIPLTVLGGVLVMIGLSLLWNWVVGAWRTFPLIDFAIVMLILLVIAIWGFLEGIAVGLVATIVMFVVSYSRSSVVKHELSGTSFHSRVTRNPIERRQLDTLAGQIYLLQLQGFIFFGTANNLFSQVRHHMERETTCYVILDFESVSGLDSTALLSFEKLVHLAQTEGVILVLSGLSDAVRSQFERGGLGGTIDVIQFVPDLDHGMEWCENDLLSSSGLDDAFAGADLGAQLALILPPDVDLVHLLPHLTRETFPAGAYLMHQGDPPDYIYFIESGQVTAQITTSSGDTVRLETMQGGRAVGELGFYLGTMRSADVVADIDTVAYRLSQAQLAHLETAHPEAASTFHRAIVHLLGERVLHLTQAYNSLLR